MIDSLRPAPVDTLSPGADDGPTGRGGSAGRRDREAVDLLPARRPGRAARRDGLRHRWPGTRWVDPDATARQVIWRFLTSRPA